MKLSSLEELFELSAAWTRKEGKRASGGLNQKGVESYRRANPGSKLKTAVTRDPSTLKKGSKASKRRASFCARMSGMKKRRTSENTANDPNSRINKSLRKWNCESLEEVMEFDDVSATIDRHREKMKDPKFRKRVEEQWKRLHLGKYPAHLRSEMKARRVAGDPMKKSQGDPVDDEAYMSSLEEVFEFGQMRLPFGKDPRPILVKQGDRVQRFRKLAKAQGHKNWEKKGEEYYYNFLKKHKIKHEKGNFSSWLGDK